MTSSQQKPFMLTPQQQTLLFAALNSNRPATGPSTAGFNMSPLQFDGSPVQGADGLSSFQNSPDLDYDYDFAPGDSSFDFSFDDANQPKMIGDLPGTKRGPGSDSADNESPEKRSHPDDDDDEDENGGAKRRESEEKVAKKPGRKPLTTEPSSKRKAQNRAAQRAFRERKEKHLKDLETKVQELEKLSEAANNENDTLRAKVDKMTAELNEYKKRVSVLTSGRPVHQGPAHPFGSLFVNNLNDVNFQFEFPKFGSLPGPPLATAKKPSIALSQQSKKNSLDQWSPSDNSHDGISPGNSSDLRNGAHQDLASLTSDLFASPLSTGAGHGTNGSSVSAESHYQMGGATATSSPSASSNSNMGGPSSSCGTSPEPFTQSPIGFKPIDTLSTIGEEQPSFGNQAPDLGHFTAGGVEDFTQWLPQTDFQFDPQLFGGYRDPQEGVLAQGFDDSFFNDALDVDFLTPYNLPMSSPAAAPPKKDLIAQIDAAKDDDEPAPCNQLLKYHQVWEKLQNCPKARSGDFDLDGLCADLQKKAKCDGTGPVVSEADFQHAVKKYLCKDEQSTATVDALTKQQAVMQSQS